MKTMQLRNSPPVRKLLKLSMEQNVYGLPDIIEDLAEAEGFLDDRSEMLMEYFSLSFKGGVVRSLPLIIDDYTPSPHKLPSFVHKLYSEVFN